MSTTASIETQGRTVDKDSTTDLLLLSFTVVGGNLALQANPMQGARRYRLVIESERNLGNPDPALRHRPLLVREARAVLSPVFAADEGEQGLLIAVEDLMMAEKGLETAVFIHLQVWGGRELGLAQVEELKDPLRGVRRRYKVPRDDKKTHDGEAGGCGCRGCTGACGCWVELDGLHAIMMRLCWMRMCWMRMCWMRMCWMRCCVELDGLHAFWIALHASLCTMRSISARRLVYVRACMYVTNIHACMFVHVCY
jgi:hypothetical protein